MGRGSAEGQKPREHEGSLPGSKDRRLWRASICRVQVGEGQKDTLGATGVRATRLWLQFTLHTCM